MIGRFVTAPFFIFMKSNPLHRASTRRNTYTTLHTLKANNIIATRIEPPNFIVLFFPQARYVRVYNNEGNFLVVLNWLVLGLLRGVLINQRVLLSVSIILSYK